MQNLHNLDIYTLRVLLNRYGTSLGTKKKMCRNIN